MRISTKGRYGLRLMLELGMHFGEGPISTEAISETQEISSNYIHNIINILQSSNLIRSIRGPKGGYILTRDPLEITVLDIITALEGSIFTVDCVADSEICKRSDSCVTRDVWSEVTSTVNEVLANITLQSLVDKQKEKDLV